MSDATTSNACWRRCILNRSTDKAIHVLRRAVGIAARTSLSLLVASVLSAAATQPAMRSAHIAGVPHVLQKPGFGGEACAEMFLRKMGVRWTQDDLFNVSGADPALGRGCIPEELAAALKRAGMDSAQARHRVDAASGAALAAQFGALLADLARGVPSIVRVRCNAGDAAEAAGHFWLVIGYDGAGDEVIYHDPAEADGANRRIGREKFCKLWPLGSDEVAAMVVRIPLMPARMAPPPARTEGFAPADYAQHVIALRRGKLPQGFTVVVQPPFVVVGDEPPATVRQRAANTVKWAVDRLKKDFFAKDPDAIMTVWLFRDRDSYDRYTREIFRDTPSTPFGYYSSIHKGLIMNIATGGGTLVHEIVHPFMHANFPECPPWFNEGLGSLYEQCGDRDGHIWGYTNWRLPHLQRAVRAGKLRSFEELTGMDARRFYGDDSAIHYAQARYLCYYLQEKGLLVRFYREFTAAVRDDPTGCRTLQKVLGEKDMDQFMKKWEQFVMGLRFP